MSIVRIILFSIAVFEIVFSIVDSRAMSDELKFCGVEWPPFTYCENGKIFKGISYEIYTEAFSRLQLNFNAEEVPWPRCIDMVEKKEYDAIIDKGSTPFLVGKFPTGIYPLAIYVRYEFPEETFAWDKMKGKVVGMVRGYAYTENIIKFDGWKKDFSTTDEMMLNKLKLERYDYVILDIFSAPILSEKVGIKIKMLKPLMDFTYLYLAFNQDKSEILKKYDKVIGDMIQDGTIDKIYLKYLQYKYSEIMNLTSAK